MATTLTGGGAERAVRAVRDTATGVAGACTNAIDELHHAALDGANTATAPAVLRYLRQARAGAARLTALLDAAVASVESTTDETAVAA